MSKVGEVQGYLYTKVILYFVCIKLSNDENIYYLNWENSALNTAIKNHNHEWAWLNHFI